MRRDVTIKGMGAGICLLALCLGSPAQNLKEDSESRENQLIALERLWNDAQIHRDSKALANMIGDKFVNTEWDGSVSE